VTDLADVSAVVAWCGSSKLLFDPADLFAYGGNAFLEIVTSVVSLATISDGSERVFDGARRAWFAVQGAPPVVCGHTNVDTLIRLDPAHCSSR
jgi:hypothetical protein